MPIYYMLELEKSMIYVLTARSFLLAATKTAGSEPRATVKHTKIFGSG